MGDQIRLNFDNDEKHWPPQDKFPINWKNADRKVIDIVKKDVANSSFLKIATGFTSLGHIVDFSHSTLDYGKIKVVDIVLGFEPERIYKRKRWSQVDLEKSIKEYWLDKSISIFKCASVIDIIEKINCKKINFRLLNKLHSKIYITDDAGMIGSSNFSKNGLHKQLEANFRINKNENKESEILHTSLNKIVDNYLKAAIDYNSKIISLLEKLLLLVSWKEAIAKAIAELLEGKQLSDYPKLLSELNNVKLWPSQRIALAQALNIVKENGNVLIAEPTGSGKTRLISSLRLTLTHWYIGSGKKHRLETLIICPKAVEQNWKNESLELSFISESQISMGLLSNSSKRNKKIIQQKLSNTDLLIIDEAHNFLSHKSQRSQSIENSIAENTILATATPINKGPKDLLRLIELLDVDNLEDREFDEYVKLRRSWSIHSSNQIDSLRSHIWKFTVRRTKKELKRLINKDPESYLNKDGIRCTFPKLKSLTYETGESNADIKIARKINTLLEKVKGIYRLQNVRIPYQFSEENKEKYISRVFNGAKALASYNIRSCLRSSRAALFEHIYGTDEARKRFNLDKLNKNTSGNIYNKLLKYRQKIPVSNIEKTLLPEWYTDEKLYVEACNQELKIYEDIGKLALQISEKREKAKADKLKNALASHNSILAFDSTVITLFYIQKILENENLECVTITGSDNKGNKKVQLFELGSTAKNIIGLCSDSVAEGVNMQQASALFHLDMPSVLRIAEQRVGRLERLDSPHSEIEIYWPDDTIEFALRSDKNLIKTLDLASSLIGANLELPDKLSRIKTKDYIKSFEESQNKALMWDGIHDAYSSVKSLVYGADNIISENEYDSFRDINVDIKCKFSIGRSDQKWVFFSLKGSENRPTKWFFIDHNKEIHTEISEICLLLKKSILEIDAWEEKWDNRAQIELDEYLKLLRHYNFKILSPRRRRALETAKKILTRQFKREKKKPQNQRNITLKRLINELLNTLEGGEANSEIDFYGYSDIWYQKLKPYLIKKKEQNQSQRNVISLRTVMKDNTIEFSQTELQEIYNNIPSEDGLWSEVSACIIVIPN